MTHPAPPSRYAPQPPANEGPTAVGLLALVLAWLVPGLGHFLIGQKARGIIFALTIHILFAAGMLIGGLRAINPPEQAIWTYTQMLAGWPMLVANRLQHDAASQQKNIDNQYEANRPPLGITAPEQHESSQRRIDYAAKEFADHPSLTYHPKVQDIGAVYCGIAGMLNLLVLFDVLLRITGSQRELPPGKRAAFDTDEPDPRAPANSPRGAA
ncbi:MAG TPA: DUF6677 family protein [Phycisphaerae bacterium]|nr:DUF6677 family protein [Phycisphaerae bacterium]